MVRRLWISLAPGDILWNIVYILHFWSVFVGIAQRNVYGIVSCGNGYLWAHGRPPKPRLLRPTWTSMTCVRIWNAPHKSTWHSSQGHTRIINFISYYLMVWGYSAHLLVISNNTWFSLFPHLVNVYRYMNHIRYWAWKPVIPCQLVVLQPRDSIAKTNSDARTLNYNIHGT